MTVIATANICNTRGLHARASAKFVKLASTFDAEVHVTRDGVTV
ncbi:MAG: HPr family phosphocarrier protein, partial [bacterium]